MPDSRPGPLARLIERFGGHGSFVVSAGKLLGGTAAAQAITIAALPVLTRIYSPAEMAVFAAFLALHNVLAVVACARLEIAIPLAAEDADGVRLTILSMSATIMLVAAICLAIVLGGPALLAASNLTRLAAYIWVLPVSVLAAGAYAATQYQATRNRRFGVIARTRVVQALAATAAQIGLGLLRLGAIGLLAGQVLMAGAGALRLGRLWTKNRPFEGVDISRGALLDTLARFRRFPVFSTPEAFANRGSTEFPMLIVAAYAIGPEAGFLLLAIKAMGAPISLLGNAAAQVFMAESRTAWQEGRLGTLTERVLLLLTKLAIGPTIFAALVAPPAFALIFGPEWHRAGVIALWMLPWSVFKTLSSPISGVLHVQMRQRAMMILQVIGLISNVGLTMAAALFAREYVVEVFSMASAAFYLLCTVVYMSAAKVGFGRLLSRIAVPAALVAAWTVAGLASLWILERFF